MANDTATRLLGRVKEIREALGLSQEAFAEKAGLGYKYYQHVEAGRRRDIRLSTLEKLANACEIKLKYLVDFENPPSVLAEDQATYDDRPSSPKRLPKPRKHRSDAK